MEFRRWLFKGVRLVDATSGELVHVDEQMARDVGSLMNEAPIRKVSVLAKPNLESRDHEGEMWRVDLAASENRRADVSHDTARVFVMRGDKIGRKRWRGKGST